MKHLLNNYLLIANCIYCNYSYKLLSRKSRRFVRFRKFWSKVWTVKIIANEFYGLKSTFWGLFPFSLVFLIIRLRRMVPILKSYFIIVSNFNFYGSNLVWNDSFLNSILHHPEVNRNLTFNVKIPTLRRDLW